jgi:hypothetical protein
MSAPTFEDQIAATQAQGANGFRDGVVIMNALVTPCPPKPRTWRTLWIRPRQHQWEDYTSALNTLTYTTMDRCKDCGYCVLGSGL